jgi:hypothetical protein
VCSNKGSATQICVGPRRNVAPRRHAHTSAPPSPSAPEAAPAEAACRLRPRLPHALRPRGSLESSRAARCRLSMPYWLSARHGPSVRRRRPTVHTPVEAGYHGRISGRAAITPEPSRSYKYPAFFPSPVGIATPPRRPRRHRRAVPLPASHGQATAHIPSLDPLGPSRATCCPGRARVIAGAEPPRLPPPVLAVRPRRRVLRPNTGHPQALGEPTVRTRSVPVVDG